MSPMSNRLLVPRKTPGLLDLVPGAAAAYSLRSLSNSYADPVVTVRRSSDDAEEDFTAAEVADGTLAAFCGAGDGFVKTWHSQAGSNDATQTTAAYQPQIVDSGVVILEEGKPAIFFDGTDDYLDCGTPIISAAATFALFTVSASDRTAAEAGGFSLVSQYNVPGTGRTNFFYDPESGRGYGLFLDGTDDLLLVSNVITQDQVLCGFFCNSASSGSMSVNGAVLSTDTATNASVLQVNTRISDTEAPWKGTVQEVIIYDGQQPSNRELIEGNIAWSYS